MSERPAYQPLTGVGESEGGNLQAANEGETLGITRFLGETYVVGGSSYTSLAEAVAQARQTHMQDAGL